jgi:hypothetical protein
MKTYNKKQLTRLTGACLPRKGAYAHAQYSPEMSKKLTMVHQFDRYFIPIHPQNIPVRICYYQLTTSILIASNANSHLAPTAN